MAFALEFLYNSLKAQIAVYAGRRNGGLATLQDLIGKLERGESIICEVCKRVCVGPCSEGHAEDCEIVEEYWRWFSQEEPQE